MIDSDLMTIIERKTFCNKNYQDEKATFRPFNGHYQAK